MEKYVQQSNCLKKLNVNLIYQAKKTIEKHIILVISALTLNFTVLPLALATSNNQEIIDIVETLMTPVQTEAEQAKTVANKANTLASKNEKRIDKLESNAVDIDMVEVLMTPVQTEAKQAKTAAEKAQTVANKANTLASKNEKRIDKLENNAVDIDMVEVLMTPVQTEAEQAKTAAEEAQKVANKANTLSTENRGKIDILTNDVRAIKSDLSNLRTDVNQNRKAIDKNRKRAARGVAGVAAMANIPSALPGKSAIGIGIGGFDGENAVAVGVGHHFENGIAIKGSISTGNATNSIAYGAGMSYSW